MSATVDRATPPYRAYSRLRRVIHAFRFVRDMANQGSESLERTKAKHIAATYGLGSGGTELVKRIKARFRNELSFGEGK